MMLKTDHSDSKRKRSEEKLLNVPPIKCAEFWLDDGNVILQAENMQFKVHKSILSMNSTVFSDMFCTPQPVSGEQLIEWCPVVHLSDTSVDVTILLEAICRRR